MQIQPELKSVLKRLRLSGILATLPDRWAYARQEQLDYTQFLELVLSEIGCAMPASRKNAAWNVSIGRPKSASTRHA